MLPRVKKKRQLNQLVRYKNEVFVVIVREANTRYKNEVFVLTSFCKAERTPTSFCKALR